MQSNGKNSKPEWFSKVQQMRNEEVDFLYEMVEQTEGDILEIGMGGSTFAFLDATKDTDRQVWSIDMRNKLEKYYDYIPQDYQERLNFIQADCQTVKLHPKLKFKMMLVDGNHMYENVRKDTFKFWDYITDYIVFHDYELQHGVTNLVKQLIKSGYADIHMRKESLIIVDKKIK